MSSPTFDIIPDRTMGTSSPFHTSDDGAMSTISSSSSDPTPSATTVNPSAIQANLFSASTATNTSAAPDMSRPEYASSNSGSSTTLSGFEGPEKLLEIWFRRPNSSGQNHDANLMNVSQDIWEEMLDIVKCKVLSTLKANDSHAFLLSESSMFVYERRLILKTCGTTTLLRALPRILEIARDYCGFTEIDALFYSRKSFLYPDRQPWPHTRWDNEVNYLDDIFPSERFETGAYVIGKMNGDHWCLYVCTPVESPFARSGYRGAIRAAQGQAEIQGLEQKNDDSDVTFEMLMQNMSPSVAQQFWKTDSSLSEKESRAKKCQASEPSVYQLTRISEIYPKASVDDYVFDPCGYSLNGLLGEDYFTIHVTPEEQCSYASFETSVSVGKMHSNHARRHCCNRLLDDYMDECDEEETQVDERKEEQYNCFIHLMRKVASVFQPKKFSTTLFVRSSLLNKSSNPESDIFQCFRKADVFTVPLVESKGSTHAERVYVQKDCITHRLGRWDLVFCHYEEVEIVSDVPDAFR